MDMPDPDRFSTPQSFDVRFHATSKGIFARATFARGTGRNYRLYRVWDGYLGVGESDLRGLSVINCTAVLISDLLWGWQQTDGAAKTHHDAAVGPGAPVGATGATVTQDPLPGM